MKSGEFQNVEDVLMQALKASPAPDEKGAGRSDEKASATGAELVEAMQASPFKEIGLEPGRERMPEFLRFVEANFLGNLTSNPSARKDGG
jgi:hypothetical protein